MIERDEGDFIARRRPAHARTEGMKRFELAGKSGLADLLNDFSLAVDDDYPREIPEIAEIGDF